MNEKINESSANFDRLLFKEALKTCFFEYQEIRDKYREQTMEDMHRDLIMKFIETQALILSPICPHVAEHIWIQVLKKVGFLKMN